MRLLNSRTFRLEEFVDDRDLEYAILSHRWGDDEPTLHDMLTDTASKKKGYAKLELCCNQALKDGLNYVWIDTCCIDKASSAELSEAINSMYRWYEKSVVCYAYLSDVESSTPEDKSFEDSKWWGRGWTLQELIAPQKVEFYNVKWEKLGTRSGLRDRISVMTGIDTGIFMDAHPSDFSIAKRMSWASRRTTTRVEDMAYCLLGIFEVNMPMLYGEGDRAFIRLQEEIMKTSDDQSLFAWELTPPRGSGLLAKSPAAFLTCSSIVRSGPRDKWNRIPYAFTNMGLSIELRMIPWAMNTYLAALDCQIEGLGRHSRIGIFLELLAENGQYVRTSIGNSDRRSFKRDLGKGSEYRNVYVRQNGWNLNDREVTLYGFRLRSLPFKIKPSSSLNDELPVSKVICYNKWSDKEMTIQIPTGKRGTAGVILNKTKTGVAGLKLGFDSAFNPICQFGGPLGTYYDHYDFKGESSPVMEIDSSWMKNENHWIFRGDKRLGLHAVVDSWRILITLEVLEIQGTSMRVWVVDAQQIGS